MSCTGTQVKAESNHWETSDKEKGSPENSYLVSSESVCVTTDKEI